MNGKPPGREAEEAKALAAQELAAAEGESTDAVEQEQAVEITNESTEVTPEVQKDTSDEKAPEAATDAPIQQEDSAEYAVVEQLKELDVNDQETFPEEEDIEEEEEEVVEDDGAGEWISMISDLVHQFMWQCANYLTQ